MTLGGILFMILYVVVWLGLIVYFIEYALRLTGINFSFVQFLQLAKRRIAKWFLRKKKK